MKKTHHPVSDIARAGTLFFRVRGMMRTKLAAGKKLDPYAWLRFETMAYIRDHDGASMKEIADYLSITAPSATSLLAGLIREGLAAKHRGAGDRRAWHISLTARGARMLSAKAKRGMKLLGTVFAPLSPRELAAFSRALERVLEGNERV